jgi:mevalonate kinase
MNDIAFEIEKKQHGTPSGIDNSVVCYQKPVFFRKGQPVEFIGIGNPMTLILANSGIHSFTKEAVDQIREKRNEEIEYVDRILNKIGNIANKAQTSIEQGDLESIGKLMLENHRLLKKLGLSLEKLDDLVELSMRSGAFGAKLCGSGKGGNVVALVPPIEANNIEKSLLKSGAESCIITTIAPNAGEL